MESTRRDSDFGDAGHSCNWREKIRLPHETTAKVAGFPCTPVRKALNSRVTAEQLDDCQVLRLRLLDGFLPGNHQETAHFAGLPSSNPPPSRDPEARPPGRWVSILGITALGAQEGQKPVRESPGFSRMVLGEKVRDRRRLLSTPTITYCA